jgi:hypothetical protein
MDLREIHHDGVDRIDSGSCPMAGYGISITELLGSFTRELDFPFQQINSKYSFVLRHISGSLLKINSFECSLVDLYRDCKITLHCISISEEIQAKNRANIVQEDIQPGSKIINVNCRSNRVCSGIFSLLDSVPFNVI